MGVTREQAMEEFPDDDLLGVAAESVMVSVSVDQEPGKDRDPSLRLSVSFVGADGHRTKPSAGVLGSYGTMNVAVGKYLFTLTPEAVQAGWWAVEYAFPRMKPNPQGDPRPVELVEAYIAAH